MASTSATTISGIGRQLRARLTTHHDLVDLRQPISAAIPEIDLVIYEANDVVSGRIAMPDERISDVLNGNLEFAISDALVVDRHDGGTVEIQRLLVRRDQTYLVDVSGPRGNAGRRRRTCQHPIVAKAGPYTVRGYVHSLPGSDPIKSLVRRRPMVAITDATVSYSFRSMPQQRSAAVILLNRDRIEWIVAAKGGEGLMVDMPVGPQGPLLKDFTYLLYA